MTRTEICDRFDITGVSLDEILEIVSTLADRESGGAHHLRMPRRACAPHGDAGRVLPLRLSAAEGAVLNHELESLGIEPQTGQLGFDMPFCPKSSAITSASLTPSTTGHTAAAELRHSGRAFAAGISYRSMDDARPRERLVDPLRITVNGDQTYLIAWDIAVDEQRTYRMDKIEGLTLTEDSVVPHTPGVASLHDSLARTQRSAKLLMPFNMAEHLDWAGITLIERSGADMATVTVHYGSERWLLSQIIAAGGAIRILDDPALSKRLCDMAKTLVCPL